MTKNKSNHHSDFPIPQKPQGTSAKSASVQAVAMKQTSVYSGPIPSAEDMERYHRINPDLVNIIMQMAMEEQQKQFELKIRRLELEKADSDRENEALKINSRNTLLSLVFSFLVVTLFLGVVALFGYLQYPLVAGVVGIGGIGSVVYYMIRESKVGKQ